MELAGYQKSGEEDARFIMSLKCLPKNLYDSLLKYSLHQTVNKHFLLHSLVSCQLVSICNLRLIKVYISLYCTFQISLKPIH